MSLYNEVRPLLLGQIKGQESLVTQIRTILKSGNIPNVSLFIGPRGTGKTTLARIFAKSMNCENPTEDGSCGECATCKAMFIGQADINELDAASHNKVEDVHTIIEGSSYRPVSGTYKVYIIDEVHMLSNAAFNALLKLLEEPPAHTKFILCTTEEHKVPVTIKSRCRNFYFQRIPISDIAEKMKGICQDREVFFETEALLMIAKASDGCMRDAESLLEIFVESGSVDREQVSSVLGSTDEESLFSILNGLFSGDSSLVCNSLREVFRKGKSLSLLVKSLMEAMTDMVLCLQSAKTEYISGTEQYKKQVETISSKTSVTKIFRIIDGLGKILPELSNTTDASFLLETTLLGFFYEESKLLELETKVEQLGHGSSSVSQCKNVSLEERIAALERTCAALENALFDKAKNDIADLQPLEDEEPVRIPVKPDSPSPVAEEDFFALPDVSGELPGDISFPEGTQVMGKISLFENPHDTDGISVTESCREDSVESPTTNTVNEEKDDFDAEAASVESDITSEEPSEDSSTTFSAFQNLWEIPIINTLATKI